MNVIGAYKLDTMFKIAQYLQPATKFKSCPQPDEHPFTKLQYIATPKILSNQLTFISRSKSAIFQASKNRQITGRLKSVLVSILMAMIWHSLRYCAKFE